MIYFHTLNYKRDNKVRENYKKDDRVKEDYKRDNR